MSNSLTLTLLPGFDGTGELFGPLHAALGREVISRTVRYTAERSLDDYVETVTRVLPTADAMLVAESFSGPVALSLLARYPERIKCAVLCATFATSPFRSLLRSTRYLPVAMFSMPSWQRSSLRHLCLNGAGDDALVDQAASVLRSLPATTIRDRLQALSEIDMRACLHRITTPILYLQAMQDRIVSPRLSRELTAALPRVTVQTISGPHLLLQSRPAECAAAIVRFLCSEQAKRQS